MEDCSTSYGASRGEG